MAVARPTIKLLAATGSALVLTFLASTVAAQGGPPGGKMPPTAVEAVKPTLKALADNYQTVHIERKEDNWPSFKTFLSKDRGARDAAGA